MSKPLLVVLSCSLMVGACAKKTPEPETPASLPPPTVVVAEKVEPPPEPPPPPPPVEEPPPAPAPLTDAQITMVLTTVDESEIAAAKLAQKKSKNPKVKKFAAMMIQHHTKSKTKGATLAKKAKLEPEQSDVSQGLKEKSSAQQQTLESADGTTFDAAYITGQVQAHDEVIMLIQERLVPSATVEALKAFLTETHAMVEQHAQQAKELQVTLAPPPPPADASSQVHNDTSGNMMSPAQVAPAPSAQ